jgi:hypothetical protein
MLCGTEVMCPQDICDVELSVKRAIFKVFDTYYDDVIENSMPLFGLPSESWKNRFVRAYNYTASQTICNLQCVQQLTIIILFSFNLSSLLCCRLLG